MDAAHHSWKGVQETRINETERILWLCRAGPKHVSAYYPEKLVPRTRRLWKSSFRPAAVPFLQLPVASSSLWREVCVCVWSWLVPGTISFKSTALYSITNSSLRIVQSLMMRKCSFQRSITQLHQAFVTISTLVHEQGAMVDRIEYHLTASADYIESSKQQLKKATKLQHKYRKKRCCVILLVISIIAIVALVIFLSVHKWNQPAPSHRHMAIYAHVRPTRSHWSGKEPLPHF